ncbi:GNAT family N-acetyltransferase [Streptomyces sp. RKND-216]|uniref:GNAT family N-acetyltransferase n=1 Tax=Streptomyces sp. RKND-216 TaxID=2562581 RepID=UPI00109DEAA9|nr:GNAT family N-acetyltransferase [Streptomyces sp. RKND-216]THA25859.1 GNAT family N-acetyltransferase [Streptomyces sp. RKND-216]
MIDQGHVEETGRRITLRDVEEENWRAVADVAPFDEQRGFVAALAARYLLLSLYEGPWRSLGVYADETVVGHVMWGRDDDGSHWIGGLLVDRAEQGRGIGRALLRTLLGWLAAQPDCWVIRMTYQRSNVAARGLYESLGFVPAGSVAAEGEDEEEILVEISPAAARRAAAEGAAGAPQGPSES